ncbi:MAG: hypothetical protein A3H42_06175 [Deltaproteobacteria bacterium RIFCSPLOWO2_02_FULL_46_8]|nr:MAG: hypothetical protein A3H42_06175 [Deltaproteobacteria bacterium RIFCSPLOWO2_02_FULL_46_8]
MSKPISLSGKQRQRLRDLGVVTLYLFGSRAQGVAGSLSDYDYGVLTSTKGHKSGDDLYMALYDFLSPISPRTLKNDVIDIVFLQSGVSLELQANVVEHGVVLFDDDPDLRAEYEAQVMMRMADIRPMLQGIDQAILQRI